MRIDYFIYYRVNTVRLAEFVASLVSMQASLHAATGVTGRFRRRLDDPATWMEIYENVSDPRKFEVELGAHAQRHGLHDYLQEGQARHMERFRGAE